MLKFTKLRFHSNCVENSTTQHSFIISFTQPSGSFNYNSILQPLGRKALQLFNIEGSVRLIAVGDILLIINAAMMREKREKKVEKLTRRITDGIALAIHIMAGVILELTLITFVHNESPRLSFSRF